LPDLVSRAGAGRGLARREGGPERLGHQRPVITRSGQLDAAALEGRHWNNDVVMWSGDPLDIRSRALRVFIGGRPAYR
jgi:hypothetical protein